MNQLKLSRFVYRCRMCGGYFDIAGVEDEPGDDANALSAIYAAIGGTADKVAGMVTAHDCKPGQIGIGDLIGIREAK